MDNQLLFMQKGEKRLSLSATVRHLKTFQSKHKPQDLSETSESHALTADERIKVIDEDVLEKMKVMIASIKEEQVTFPTEQKKQFTSPIPKKNTSSLPGSSSSSRKRSSSVSSTGEKEKEKEKEKKSEKKKEKKRQRGE